MVQLVAPAKLTVSLRVTGRRDDGFHLLDAEMVTLDLCDRMRVEPGPRTDVTATGPHAPVDGLGPDDLVSRALSACGRTARVELDKQIPAGAGLGGGSSDAAAVLRWAGVDDLALAAALGADVPFCLVGGRARVAGVGEVIEPLPFIEATYTLLTPPIHCATPAVYRRWDQMGAPTDPGGNDLTPAALDLLPTLAEWRDRLEDATGVRARLAGSGSTWFVEGAFPGPGRIVTRTVPAGWAGAGAVG
jgi:4-diphosphocytidyl-2-C-methyl-D-erythritol kinase